jgi:IS5 family transposase
LLAAPGSRSSGSDLYHAEILIIHFLRPGLFAGERHIPVHRSAFQVKNAMKYGSDSQIAAASLQAQFAESGVIIRAAALWPVEQSLVISNPSR